MPTGRRRDLQGIRALAIIAVVTFHAGALRGGFVGVDAFYVLSGFLITGLLWRDLSTGQLSLVRFWARRARRLLPAALVVLVTTGVAVALLAPPLRVGADLRDIAAAAAYIVNYRLAAQSTDYLNADAPPSPVQHYWSLAVEEQFYLLWPLLLLGVVVAYRRRVRHEARRHRPPTCGILAVLVVVAVVSFGVNLVLTRSAPPWAFFGLPSRVWELALGGLVALAVPRERPRSRTIAEAAAATGLLLLVASVLLIGAGTAYPGAAALAPVGGTTLLIAGMTAHPGTAAARLLGTRVLQPLGAVSYSWYLWHWPVLVLAPRVLGRPALTGDETAAAVLISLVLATGSYLLVEQPALRAPLREAGRRTVSAALAGVAAVSVAVLVFASLISVPIGHGGAVAAPRLLPLGHAVHAHSDPARDRLRQLTAQVQRQLAIAVGRDAVPEDLTPSLADAHADKATPFTDGCHLDYYGTTSPPCAYGDLQSATRVVLLGDSHAVQWFPALDAIATRRRWRLEDLTKTICPPLLIHLWQPGWGRAYTECDTWRAGALRRIRAEHPALVVLGVARHYGPEYRIHVYDRTWLDGLAAVVRTLRDDRAAVLVMGPTPKPQRDVPDCLADHLSRATRCGTARATAVDASGAAAERRTVEHAGGSYAEVPDWLCTAQSCPPILGDALLYRDDNHLTTTYVDFLTPLVAAELDLARAATSIS